MTTLPTVVQEAAEKLPINRIPIKEALERTKAALLESRPSGIRPKDVADNFLISSLEPGYPAFCEMVAAQLELFAAREIQEPTLIPGKLFVQKIFDKRLINAAEKKKDIAFDHLVDSVGDDEAKGLTKAIAIAFLMCSPKFAAYHAEGRDGFEDKGARELGVYADVITGEKPTLASIIVI